MKTLTKAFFTTTLCLLVAIPAYAGHSDRYDGFRERMQQLDQRIEHGIRTHELSRKEAKELEQQQHRIHRLAREFREDGRLSRKERYRLENELDRLSDQITEYKHNRHNKPKYRYGHERHDDDRGGNNPYNR